MREMNCEESSARFDFSLKRDGCVVSPPVHPGKNPFRKLLNTKVPTIARVVASSPNRDGKEQINDLRHWS